MTEIKGITVPKGLGKTLIVICDLDNCFFDSRLLEKYVPKDKLSREGWDEFSRHYDECTPNKTIIDLVLATEELLPIYFLTAREDLDYTNVREVTEKTIYRATNGRIDFKKPKCQHKLIMRKAFDYRASAEVKKDMLIEVVQKGFYPVLAIDDDITNCEMFNLFGVKTKLYDIEKDELGELNVNVSC